jgi:hypothetical protein
MRITDLNSILGGFDRLRSGLGGGPKLGTARYGSIMHITRQRERGPQRGGSP